LPLVEADNVGRGQWPFFDDVLAHPKYDEFWKPLNFTNRINEINAPALFVSGWYDIFNTAQLRDFQSWQAGGPDAPKARLIVGPWNHAFYNTNLKNVDWGWKDALDNALEPCLLWFDHWLKGINNGIDLLKPVHIYVMGQNNWRDFDQWPPDGTQAMDFYLASSGDANSSNGKGRLSTEASRADEPLDSFYYDPLKPVPTRGGAGMLPWKAGPAEQNEIEQRSDVLIYSTEPFNKSLIFIGSVSVKLFAATSAVDTDFTAKLVDVYPNGKALIVNDGILRGRYREGGEAKMLTPGEVYEWNIDLGYTALKINPGHRIRLEISSSNFPRYNRNLNTGENIATSTRTVIAHQKVFHSAQYPSRLILNVLSE
jgi:putative CocE/NonD family hydrolase